MLILVKALCSSHFKDFYCIYIAGFIIKLSFQQIFAWPFIIQTFNLPQVIFKKSIEQLEYVHIAGQDYFYNDNRVQLA